MAGWADDPELLATFRAEVEERIASLQAGLLALESHPSPRHVVASLFRDAHTVKGSARMLGLSEVLAVAHSAEDLLGALREGRLTVRRDLVDLLLAACDGIVGALPGVDDPVPNEHLHALSDAMQRATAGEEPATVPQWVRDVEDDDAVDDGLRRGGESVRITTAKVYDLIDVVGEAELDARRLERMAATIDAVSTDSSRWLRTVRDALAAGDHGEELAHALTRLVAADDQMLAAAQDLRELADDAQGRLSQVRDGAMGLAMVPVRRVVAGLPRLVRDLAAANDKEIRLVLDGQDVELDKQVLDGVSDALKHLVVNAVDHGCEPAAERLAAGKPAQSTVTVSARAAGGTVVIEVSDDGAGIDDDRLRATAIARGVLLPDSALTGQALHNVLFMPGFTTTDHVTETSGRGIGLDVVRGAVEGLGGLVELRSSRRGTTFMLTLPVTLGVLRCLMARLGDERFALPVPGIVESLSLKNAVVHSLAGNPVVVRHGETLPLLDLGSALGVGGDRSPEAAVVVRHGERQVAWAVDALDGERELVVKELGAFIGRPPVISGATIDGDGTVVCLVDLRELGDESAERGSASYSALFGSPDTADLPAQRRPRVLVVEDSLGVRELERAILESAGYDVTTAIDGTEGAARLVDDPADLVLSDVEMPGMDGFALTRTIRRTKGWEQVPVVIMTSRGGDDDQRAGLDAGASAYLLKTEFDQEQLVETVRRLVGR
jgi:chemotaxis protein histidine kinase CheA